MLPGRLCRLRGSAAAHGKQLGALREVHARVGLFMRFGVLRLGGHASRSFRDVLTPCLSQPASGAEWVPVD